MFGKRGRRRKAQAATEHMGLAGIILIAVVILAYFVSEGTRTGGLQIEDAIGTIDNTVEGLSNIGAGSIETVIISSPKGVKSAEFISCEDLGDGELRCPAIQINYSDGRIDIFTMKYFVYGSLEFLKTPGIHRVTLYHDGTMGRVLFIECGDGDVNGWEECEWCDGNEDCATNTCINNICAPLGEIENDCNNLGFYSGSEGCYAFDNALGCLCYGDYCGDDIINGDEECELDDDCIIFPDIYCNSNCICDDHYGGGEYCGDGEVNQAWEDCDDGSASGNYDMCIIDPPDYQCKIAFCGDGYLCSDASCTTGPTDSIEYCDDGNKDNGDGCSSICDFEDPDPCDNIISYWKFDETEGSIVHDLYGDHGGEKFGLASWESTITRVQGCNSIYFPDQGNYASVYDHGDFDFQNSFSIELWTYIKTGTTAEGLLFIHSTAIDENVEGVSITYDALTDEIVGIVSDGTSGLTLKRPVEKNKWQHIALSRDKQRNEIMLCVSSDRDNIDCITQNLNAGTCGSTWAVNMGPRFTGTDLEAYVDELAVFDASMIEDRVREHISRIEDGDYGYCGEGDCYTGPSGVCGDGDWDPINEECDDGDSDPDDTYYDEPVDDDDGLCVIDDDRFYSCMDAICGDGYLCANYSCVTGPKYCEDAKTACDNNADCVSIGGGSCHGWAEECDDANILNNDGCNEYCMFETHSWYCGNGIREPEYGEECDGEDFGGYECTHLDEYTGGNLTCMPPKHEHECTISVANCTGGSGVTCGDYQVCIGSCPGGEVCNSTASGCDCVEFATPQCGNGVIEQDEECEPPNSWVAIQIIPCQFGGYTTSWVGCDHTCHFTGNFNMWPPCPEGAEDPYCGDEKIGGDEQCDPPGEKWKIMDVDCEWPPPDQETWWCECDGQCKLFQYADPECADKPPDPPPNNWVTVLIDWFIALLEGVGEAITNALQKIF